MKRLIALLLAVMLVLGISIPASAAEPVEVAMKSDKTSLKAGETVALTLSIDQALANINDFQFVVSFDASLFDYIGGTVKESYADLQISDAKIVETTGTINVWGADPIGDPITMASGDVAELQFTAKTDASADSAAFGLKVETFNDYDFNAIATTVNNQAAEITIVPAPAVTYGITVNASENGIVEADKQAAAEGETVTLTVTPADGYQLDTLTVMNGETAVEVTENAFTMPAGEVTVSATFKQVVTVTGYTVTMPADISIVTGETASIPVVVDNADGSAYNAFDMSFTYDASKLELTSTEIDGMTVTAENGTVRVQRYGSDLSVGAAAFTLTFKAIGTGETTVTATEAKVGIAENAHELDAADATILDDATVITIGGYSVTLPDDFTGESTVAPGEDYTFEAKDKNYDYDVTAKIGDTEFTVTDNGDGTFTIPADQITGNIVITSTKEGKTFDVSLGDDMTGETSAQYMTPYTATLTKVDGYTYDLKVKIGDADYTDFTYDEATGVVTIPGADITGKIEFNSNKTAVQPTEYTVTFEGNGAGDVAEGAASKVEAGADYSFTLNKAEGHTYTVSYKMGSSTESVALTEADGKYTIEKVNGNLVITIEKESDLAVEVSTYVELDGKTVFLVRATGTLADGKAYAYNGDTMYYSNVYKAWSFLVITEGTLSVDEAKAVITAVEAEYTTLDQTFDVNMTSKVDVNDAQLVYNIYNCEYSDFTVANMQKFLYADTNGDMTVNTSDAAAVVNNIPKA